jgi:hypothetical protein
LVHFAERYVRFPTYTRGCQSQGHLAKQQDARVGARDRRQFRIQSLRATPAGSRGPYYYVGVEPKTNVVWRLALHFSHSGSLRKQSRTPQALHLVCTRLRLKTRWGEPKKQPHACCVRPKFHMEALLDG